MCLVRIVMGRGCSRWWVNGTLVAKPDILLLHLSKYDFYEVILEALRSFQLVYLDYNLHCTKTIMVCSELRTSCWALLAQTPDHAADVRFLGKF